VSNNKSYHLIFKFTIIKTSHYIFTKEVIIIHAIILSRYQELKKQIQDIQKQLSTMPDGDLCCTNNGKYQKWYQVKNHIYTYIPKKQKEFAEQLALKKYLITLLEDLTKEKEALQNYLKNTSDTPNAQKLLQQSEYNKLLQSYFQPSSQEISGWSKASYEHNTSHPEHLIHKCISGNIVRSKSESLIDMILYANKIPYRYECALQFDDATLYPDFTILHPRTNELFYWEHFGMMDKPSYVQKNNSRLQIYLSHDIIPGKNLIITYETSNHPLDLYTIEKILQVYFL